MALTPQNNEAFLREVDEELRRDRLGQAWRSYGRLLIGLVIVGLAIFGGYLWWQAQREKTAGLAGEKLVSAFDALSQGRPAEADAKLKALAGGEDIGYRGLAKLTQAARKLEAGDEKGASVAYLAIASDAAMPRSIRDAALVRSAAAGFDSLPPGTVIERLKPLASPGNAWFGPAAEMTAIAWMKLHQPQKAAAIFATIAKDRQVPDSLRSRAMRISGAFEAGAAASPAAPQKEKSE